MTAPSPALERFCVLGDNNDVRFARELGAETDTASHTSTLGSTDIALVGKVTDQDFEALGKWVKNGGTAVLLPQPLNRYKMIPTPSIKAASMIPFHSLPDTEILNGLGQNDFHYRQPLNMLTFYGTANIADINDGKGRWVLLGFNPRDLKLDDEPYLRLTYRHQCRAISQILTNLGVSLPTPMRMVLERIKQSPINIDITSSAVARIAEKNDSLGNSWIKPEFDDSQWKLFGLATKSTQFGHAFLRIKFTAPELKDDGGLIADLGTMDDYDETYLNGVRIGSINPTNSMPDTAFGMRRLYPLPAGLLRPGQENVLAIYVWNRNAESKGWKAWVRGPMHIRRAEPTVSPYAGNYKHSDDPYLQRHW
jgi:hypothetical protein